MKRASYEWHQLPGGPRLAVATLPDSECAALSIYVPAGSRDESNAHAGLAHFVEHMVFKGTQRRDAKQLTFEIENAGGQLNASTTEERTVYEGSGEAELMPLLADLLSDMAWHATFPEREIDLEREVIGEEITMYRESPSDHIDDLISAALWSDHPLGHSISGSLDSIRTLGRRELMDFRQLHHFRSDMVISAAGPFRYDEVQAMLAPHLPQAFGHGTQPQRFERNGLKPLHLIDGRESDQLQLALAWHTTGRKSETRHALRMMSMMLGGSASSRLFLELREDRGLCYQISSEATLFDETGALEIVAGLDPESRGEALDCIYRQIADLQASGPRPGELDRVKKLLIARSKQSFESTEAHAAWAGEALLDYGHIPDITEWRERIMAVTDAEIQQAACAVFDGQDPAIAEI